MIDIQAVMEEVNKQKGLSFQPIESESPYIAMYSGEYLSYGRLKIGFLSSFPYSLPAIFITGQKSRRLHVDDKGKICLIHESSLLLDVNRPEQIIIDAFELAERVLSLTPEMPEYRVELRKEFLSYWGQQEHGRTIWSILSIERGRSILKVPLFRHEKGYILAPSHADANSFLCDYYGLPPISGIQGTAWVIPLKEDAEMPSPFIHYTWSDIIRYFKENAEEDIRRQFWNLSDRPVKKAAVYLVFIAPSQAGDIVFGVAAFFNNRHNLPIKVSQTSAIYQLDIQRFDSDFLLSRGGAPNFLKDRRVLLLGCGSIGGFLANNLCQMGITKLDLLDNDYFIPYNVHRHFMGFEAIKKTTRAKADLLRNSLCEKYPYVDIDSLNYVDRSVECTILQHPERLSQYDLIISALGEPTLNLAINDLLIEHKILVPFLVCFNEPYGIGGHVITTNLSKESCLRCFYSDLEDGTLCAFLGSLTGPNQNFVKSISGCSGSFVPYSTLDSQQTAIHAARKALAVLDGSLTHNDFFTWRGDSSLLESQGFCASAYFYEGPLKEPFTNPRCPICKRRKGSS